MYTKTQTAETLVDAMVTEGIADHFATNMCTDVLPPWTDAFTPEQSERLWPRIRRRLEVSDMNEIRRMLFGDSDRIPTWTGYKYGYQIVETYLEKHGGVEPTSLVGLSAKTIFEGARFDPTRTR